MALAIDSSTPAAVIAGTDPWTTASFTPPVGSLLVVSVAGDWFSSTPSMTITSTGLRFRRLIRKGADDQGVAEIWAATVGSLGGSARTVSVDTSETSSTGGIKVYVITGFNTKLWIDATAGGNNVSSDPFNAPITTLVDNAWALGVGEDWNNLGTMTSTDTYESGTPGGIAPIFVRKSAATSPAGAATLNMNAAASGPLISWAALSIRPDTAADPAIYLVDVRGEATPAISASASTAVDMPAAGSIVTGHYLIARIAMDNSGTNGAAPTCTITDPRSNTWTVVGPANNDPGAASAGSTTYLAYAKVVNAYTNGDDITVNHTGAANPAAKAVVIEEWAGIHPTTPVAVSASTATGTTAAVSISKTPNAAGQLVYVALGAEAGKGDAATTDTDTLEGTWEHLYQTGTTNATATNNQMIDGAAKLVSGTSAQTFNVTLPVARDWGAVAIVFAPGATSATGTAAGTFGFTGTASGVPTTHGTATGSFGFTATASGHGPQKFVTSTAGSGTGSYFADQGSDPILIRGYVLWGLLMNAGRWNGGDWELDLENAVSALQAMGCNVVYTEPLGNTQNGGAFNNGNTHDGVAPFSSTSPVTFNNTFWARSDYLFDLCEAAGITVFFNFAYSDDLDSAALSGFTTTQFGQYGTALAARYKTRPNLVWMTGGDYFDTHNTQITAVKTAIRAEGDTHLFGVQNYPETTSRKDIENNATNDTGTDNSEFTFVYSYNAIYWGIEYGWTETSPLPVLWGDGHFDQDTTADRKVMRDLTWWTFSSGGRGMIYGSEGTWAWASGALANLTSDTFPNTDMGGIWNLFTGFTNWHLLVPDTDSSFVTAGRGTKSDYVTSSGGGGGEYNSSDTQAPYVTAAITPDGTLAVVYFPVDQTITVDDTELNAGYTATWVDPISGATSSATIASTYSPTGNNSLGGPDWLLVFEASAAAVTGQATGSFGFTGAANGVDRSVGAATGSFGFTGTAAGVDRALGVAVAALGFTATASGSAGTPPVTGTADGSFGFTGAAAGVPRTSGVAAASFGFTAATAGIDRAVGAATAAFGFVGAASGVDRAVGAGSGVFGFAAAASGVPEVFAVAVAVFGFTGTVQGFAGTPPVTGVATGSFGFTAATQGQPRTPGVAAAAFGFTGTAQGRPRVVAAAVGVYAFTGTLNGVRRSVGAAHALFAFTALTNGQGATVNADSLATVTDPRSGAGTTTAKRTSTSAVAAGANSQPNVN